MTQAMPSAHFERQVDLYKALASTLGAVRSDTSFLILIALFATLDAWSVKASQSKSLKASHPCIMR